MTTDEKRYVYIYGGIDSSLNISNNLFVLDTLTWTWEKCFESHDNESCGFFGCSLTYYKGSLIRYGGIGAKKYLDENIML